MGLAAASHQLTADKIAAHLGFFDPVLATTDTFNLKGPNKRDKLVSFFGEGCFDYAANDKFDLSIRPHASSAIVVNASKPVANRARATAKVRQEFGDDRHPTWKNWLQAATPSSDTRDPNF